MALGLIFRGGAAVNLSTPHTYNPTPEHSKPHHPPLLPSATFHAEHTGLLRTPGTAGDVEFSEQGTDLFISISRKSFCDVLIGTYRSQVCIQS